MIRKKRMILNAVIIVLTGIFIWMFWANKAVEVNNYIISSERIPESFDGFRIAHLSDLHNEEFGKGNEKLLRILEDSKPDLIAITGDLVDSSRTNIDVALSFVQEAAKLAPVCYVTGNHEYFIEAYDALEQGLLDAGAAVLHDKAITLENDSEHIRIAGFDDPCFWGYRLFIPSGSFD